MDSNPKTLAATGLVGGSLAKESDLLAELARLSAELDYAHEAFMGLRAKLQPVMAEYPQHDATESKDDWSPIYDTQVGSEIRVARAKAINLKEKLYILQNEAKV